MDLIKMENTTKGPLLLILYSQFIKKIKQNTSQS